MNEMPRRTEVDGPVGLSRPDEDTIAIEVCHGSDRQRIVATRYNAARVLVMLCVMLEVPPPKALGKLPL